MASHLQVIRSYINQGTSKTKGELVLRNIMVTPGEAESEWKQISKTLELLLWYASNARAQQLPSQPREGVLMGVPSLPPSGSTHCCSQRARTAGKDELSEGIITGVQQRCPLNPLSSKIRSTTAGIASQRTEQQSLQDQHPEQPRAEPCFWPQIRYRTHLPSSAQGRE